MSNYLMIEFLWLNYMTLHLSGNIAVIPCKVLSCKQMKTELSNGFKTLVKTIKSRFWEAMYKPLA
jgi:hypothetical protein